jgi:hypothetical protein
MWLTSAGLGPGHRKGRDMRFARVTGIVAPLVCGAVERGEIMQAFSILRPTVCQRKGVIGFGNQIVEVPWMKCQAAVYSWHNRSPQNVIGQPGQDLERR